MLNIGKNGFAFTTRLRVMENTKKMDGKLLNQFISENVGDPGLPYNFSTSGDNLISVNAWTEFGASFGRVLLDKGPHYFKGGITLKYLAGVANGYRTAIREFLIAQKKRTSVRQKKIGAADLIKKFNVLDEQRRAVEERLQRQVPNLPGQ